MGNNKLRRNVNMFLFEWLNFLVGLTSMERQIFQVYYNFFFLISQFENRNFKIATERERADINYY